MTATHIILPFFVVEYRRPDSSTWVKANERFAKEEADSYFGDLKFEYRIISKSIVYQEVDINTYKSWIKQDTFEVQK